MRCALHLQITAQVDAIEFRNGPGAPARPLHPFDLSQGFFFNCNTRMYRKSRGTISLSLSISLSESPAVIYIYTLDPTGNFMWGGDGCQSAHRQRPEPPTLKSGPSGTRLNIAERACERPSFLFRKHIKASGMNVIGRGFIGCSQSMTPPHCILDMALEASRPQIPILTLAP